MSLSALLALACLVQQAPPAAPPRLAAETAREVHDQVGGGSRSFRIESAILGQTRRVFVHLPASFESSSAARRYPTMVVFDGEWMLRPVVTASEILSQAGQIPEAVIASIENTDDYEGRLHDLTPPGLSVSGSSLHEGGERFLDFVEKELLPALDAQFKGSAPRTLIGTSSGGILVTYAAATRPAFRLTLALDAPTHFGDGWLGKKLAERARANPAPLRYVSMRARFGWSDDEWAKLAAAAPSSWKLHQEALDHEAHESMQFLGAYLGLRELFADYSMLAAPEAPTTSILPWYEKLTSAYGAPLTPPAPLLARVVDDLLMEGRGAGAHAAFDQLVAAYGEPRDAPALRERIAEVEKLPPPTETVEALLATPFPTVAEARDYLGEWEGELWIHPDAKGRLVLRLEVQGDAVVGTMLSWPEPTVERRRPLQYLKVTPEGLSFGDMNGMRPRALLLHEGRREGDVLSGEVRFGGVRLTPPDGHPVPTHHFSLRKKKNS